MKILCLTLALLLALGAAAACTPTEGGDETASDTATRSDTDTTEGVPEGTEAPTDSGNQETEAPATGDSGATETSDDPTVEPTPTNTRPAQEVKVISMNLDANETTASARVRRMAPLLLSFEPDSIGVQECRGSWIGHLKRYFQAKGYARVGVDAGGNTDANSHYFATYILYKEDKFNLVDSGTFWMTNTPDVPSVYGPTVDANRTCTWALLEDKVTGFRYVHMNCHLDWMDMSVNKIQVEMIREQIERFEAMGYPVFAGGDYNCYEGTASYLTMLESDTVTDAKKVAEKANDIASYPNYGVYDVYDPAQRPIDYFFVTKDHMTVKEYRVVDEKPDGEYISDHFPVFVHALVKEMPIKDQAELLPAFPEGEAMTLQATSAGVEITLKQAKNAALVTASQYKVELILGGKTLIEQTKTSGVLRLNNPEVLTFSLNGLTESGVYTVKITPVNIFGDEGEAVTGEVEYTREVTAEPMAAPDILDIQVGEDGPVDASPNGYKLLKKGATSVTDTDLGRALAFQKKGNYAIPDIKNHYGTMTKGFTLEVYFTTGEDVNSFQSLVSNMHAGGFGADWRNGQITFSVRIGSSYVGASAPIQPNTTYHLVGVFDGDSVRLYVNGALMGATPVDGPMVLPTDKGAEYLCIGADSDATGAGEYACEGLIYSVRMYTRPATDGQAKFLFEQLGQNG